MQVEMLVHDGKIIPPLDLKFRRGSFSILAKIPPEAMEPKESESIITPAAARVMQEQRTHLDAILESPSPDVLPELTSRQEEKLSAFSMREDQ